MQFRKNTELLLSSVDNYYDLDCMWIWRFSHGHVAVAYQNLWTPRRAVWSDIRQNCRSCRTIYSASISNRWQSKYLDYVHGYHDCGWRWFKGCCPTTKSRFQICCANSLIPLDDSKANLFNDPDHTNSLRRFVETYFNARKPHTKKKRPSRSTISLLARTPALSDNTCTKQLKSFNPFITLSCWFLRYLLML